MRVFGVEGRGDVLPRIAELMPGMLARKSFLIVAVAVAWMGMAATDTAAAVFGGGDEAGAWEEVELRLPASPKQEDLVGFYVSAGTDNRFFVDEASVSVGSDGVVRYVLVVLSAAGARNVSYEGIRCGTRERRLYAFGRADGAWSLARAKNWERVRDVPANRHHAALFQEYFCPGGVIVRDAEDARRALRRGGQGLAVGS